MRGLVAGLLASMLACSGCGSAKTAPGASGLPRGSAIYARSCAGCHTIAGHESGASGGDLLIGGLSVAALASFAEAMPVDPALSRTEALSVARYIHGRRPLPRCPAPADVSASRCRLAGSPPE